MNKDLIQKLAETIKTKNITLLLGAGVSRNSGLPIVRELLMQIFTSHGVDAKDVEQIVDSQIPFETVMSYLADQIDISRLVKIFSGGNANPNHEFVAQLAHMGFIREAFTTNWDTHIESALRNRNVPFNVVDYTGQIDHQPTEFCLHKVHGSIENRIQILLRTIANAKWQKIVQEPGKKLLKGGQHSTVLVIGYSFSDHFDINPLIKELSGTGCKEIIVVNHCDSFSTNGFENHVLRGYDGMVVNCDTDQLIAALSQSLSLTYDPNPPVFDWQVLAREWTDSLNNPKGLRHAFLNGIGLIFIAFAASSKR
jgi:hypothetical protein